MYTKGIVRAYDTITGLVTVEIVGSHPYYVDLPAATHLRAQTLTDGKRCLVIMFDESNPDDGLVVATYDEVASLILPSPTIDAVFDSDTATDEITTTSSDVATIMQVDIPTYTTKMICLLIATVRINATPSGTLFGLQFYEINTGGDAAIGNEFIQNIAADAAWKTVTLHILASGGQGVTGYKLKWRRTSVGGTCRMDIRYMSLLVMGAA